MDIDATVIWPTTYNARALPSFDKSGVKFVVSEAMTLDDMILLPKNDGAWFWS